MYVHVGTLYQPISILVMRACACMYMYDYLSTATYTMHTTIMCYHKQVQYYAYTFSTPVPLSL